jgi:hypothetical protein
VTLTPRLIPLVPTVLGRLALFATIATNTAAAGMSQSDAPLPLLQQRLLRRPSARGAHPRDGLGFDLADTLARD